MKSFLLASVSLLILAGTAAAADMPLYPATKAPVMAPGWTGPYIGLNAGAVWNRMRANLDVENIHIYSASTRNAGATAGGQIGYNWQQQNFVYGVQADLNWARARGSTTARQLLVPTDTADFSSRLSWFGTVRARAGFTTSPTLYYVTGGVAFAGIRNHAESADLFSFGSSGTRTGWTAGGGVEHLFAHNMSVKAEVLYMDFGSKTIRVNQSGNDFTGRFKNTAVVGRLGVNVKW